MNLYMIRAAGGRRSPLGAPTRLLHLVLAGTRYVESTVRDDVLNASGAFYFLTNFAGSASNCLSQSSERKK